MRTQAQSSALRREPAASSRIPYVAHVSPTLISTENGEFIQSFRLGGASFESADDEVLNNWHERLNVLWRNLASPNVALWTHIVRRRERPVVSTRVSKGFGESLSHRYEHKLANETLMVNDLYLSVAYRPVIGAAPNLISKVLSRQRQPMAGVISADAIDACDKIANTVSASLARYEPEALGVQCAGKLRYSALLDFLAYLVNGERVRVPSPQGPIADALATTRVIFGSETIEYRMPTRSRYGAMLGIKEYATPSMVGQFNRLLSASFEFVLTQSFTFLTKGASQGLLQRQFHQMHNAGDFAVSQAEELKEALDALTANDFVLGDHHFSLQVLSLPIERREEAEAALRRLNDDVAHARSILGDTGIVTAREDLALEAAFWAQLPGCFGLRPRKAAISSRNFAAYSAFHNFPAGAPDGNHWGKALALLITSARSPYFFSLHARDPTDADGGSRKDTGHTFICGPTGSGKSVLIGFLISLLARRSVTQVIFDKDRGLDILVRALGGTYLPLKAGESTGFNPLQLAPTAATVEFLRAWLRVLVRGSEPLAVQEEADLDHALQATLALDPPARRLSRLVEFTDATRSDGLAARLARWCQGGTYGWAFDNAVDQIVPTLAGSPLTGIDVTEFLDNPALRGPVTLYLFHLVRTLLDGRPFVCWMDEFWRLLADPSFESFAKDGPKTWRKLNGALCVATQSPSDVLGSSISRTIIEQTPTKIFFPNPDADGREYQEGFGLSEREFKLVKEQLEPGSRMFLVKQGHQSVVCELDLKGFDAELKVLSGRASTVEELDRLVAQVGADPAVWLPRFQSLSP